MALEYKLHNQQPHPWGYEILITFIDDNDQEYNELMLFPKKPTKTDIDKMVQFWQNKVEASIIESQKEPDETMFKSEVEEMLIEKGYLTEGQTLKDLIDKKEAK